MMNTLLTIRDSDLGFDTSTPPQYRERRASRALVFDENGRVALLHATLKNYHKLPGGGVEEGEEIIEALRRECLEEIGCAITDIRELGIVEEYRDRFQLHQLSYCYIARLDGREGVPQLESDELAEGFETVWLELPIAIQFLASDMGTELYEAKFMTRRDLAFLTEASRQK